MAAGDLSADGGGRYGLVLIPRKREDLHGQIVLQDGAGVLDAEKIIGLRQIIGQSGEFSHGGIIHRSGIGSPFRRASWNASEKAGEKVHLAMAEIAAASSVSAPKAAWVQPMA